MRQTRLFAASALMLALASQAGARQEPRMEGTRSTIHANVTAGGHGSVSCDGTCPTRWRLDRVAFKDGSKASGDFVFANKKYDTDYSSSSMTNLDVHITVTPSGVVPLLTYSRGYIFAHVYKPGTYTIEDDTLQKLADGVVVELRLQGQSTFDHGIGTCSGKCRCSSKVTLVFQVTGMSSGRPALKLVPEARDGKGITHDSDKEFSCVQAGGQDATVYSTYGVGLATGRVLGEPMARR